MIKANTQSELFTALQSLAEAIPEMRVAQLLAAVGELCADLHGRGLWEATDAEFLEAVGQFQRHYEAEAARNRLKVLQSAEYLANTGMFGLAFCVDTILIEIPALPRQDYLQLFEGAIKQELRRVARECTVEDLPLSMTDFEPHVLELLKQGLILLTESQKRK